MTSVQESETAASAWSRPAVRRLAVAAFAIAASVSCVLVLRSPADDLLADLQVYWGAVRWVAHGLPLYEFRADNGDPFTYPPFASLLLAPIGRLPFVAAEIVWTVISLAAIVALARLVTVKALAAPAAARPAVTWLVALGVLVSAPGQSNVHFGQVSLLLVLACLADGLGVTGPRWRGVLIGVAAAVKLTPLLFIAYLLVSGQRRAAARAGTAFAAATALAWLLDAADSREFWTSAVFATDRIGDITALGNQSVNGMLLRAGLPTTVVFTTWLATAGALVAAAVWRARRLHRDGQEGHAIVLVGCATIAASPVSWTHHQFWTLIAAMLLMASTGTTRRVAGAVLLVLMTLNVGTIIAAVGAPTPGAGYLADNIRALATCLVCTTALLAATSRQGKAQPDPATARRRTLARRGLVSAAAATFALFLVLPVPTRGGMTITPAPAGAAGTHANDSWPTCVPAWACRIGGELYPVNYGASWSDDGVTVLGLAGAGITRIDYVPAPGRKPVTIRLDQTGHGDQAFEFAAGDTTYAQLIVYRADSRPLGEYGGKLRAG